MKIVVITLCILSLLSCKQKSSNPHLSPRIDEVASSDTILEVLPEKKQPNINEIINRFDKKTLPIQDHTTYDSVTEDHFLTDGEIVLMSLDKVYPTYLKEGYNYRMKPGYRIHMSDDFHTLVFTVFSGENELESSLVNYTLDWNLIDQIVVAYDEIAEGWSQKKSTIQKASVTVTNILWLEEKQETITKYKIMPSGKIILLKSSH